MADFNQAPYFDDFDQEKKFLKVLFRPGFSLQARELTQLQSILQNQVTRFGDFMFKNKAIVIPGASALDLKSVAIKLQPTSPADSSDVNTFLNSFINQSSSIEVVGQTTGMRAKINHVELGDGTDSPTLFVQFTNSGFNGSTKQFNSGETLDINVNGVDYQVRVEVASDGLVPITNSSLARVSQGVVYVNGYFVLVTDQVIVLDKYSATPSYSVGLDIIESVVTPEDDDSLYDNAQGSSNFTAPGAHRFKIDLSLNRYEINGFGENFIELFRVRDGFVEHQARPFELAYLQEVLAQRTFEESGDYAVTPFELEIKEHRNNDRGLWATNVAYVTGDVVQNESKFYVALSTGVSGTGAGPVHNQGSAVDGTVRWRFTDVPSYNFGLYSPANGGDSSKVVFGVKPGVAYVKGFRAETLGTTFVEANKARTFTLVTDSGVTASVGNYIDINLEGSPNLSTFETVDLFEIDTGITTGTITTTANSKAVTAANLGSIAVGDVFLAFSNTNRFVMKSNSTGTTSFSALNAAPQAATTINTFRTRKVGTARVRYVDGAGGYERMSLFDVVLNEGKNFSRDVKVICSQTQSIDLLARGYLRGSNVALSGAMTIATTGAVTGSATTFTTDFKVGDVVQTEGVQQFVVVAITNDTTMTVKPNPAAQINTARYVRVDTPLNEPENNDLIFELPRSSIRKIRGGSRDEVAGTTYTVMRKFIANTDAGDPAVLSISVSEPSQFISSDLTDYVIIAGQKDGSILASGEVCVPQSISVISPQEIRITLNAASSVVGSIGAIQNRQFEIFAPVRKRLSAGSEKTKTLISSFIDVVGLNFAQQQSISLGFADIYRVTKVEMHPSQTFGISSLNTSYDSTGNSVGGVTDITNLFTLDNGQRDTHYAIGSLRRGSAVPVPTAPFRIFFEYFSHSTTGDYFSVDSYTDLLYEEIPAYTSPLNGKTVALRDVFDFRPRMGVDGNFISTGASTCELPKRGLGIECDFTHYLPRKDKIILTRDGGFQLIAGVPAEIPTFPDTPKECMHLYDINLGAYTFTTSIRDIQTTRKDHKRFTMSDMARLEKRIENLEQATALSLLERDTASLTITDSEGFERFKNGFVVDGFSGHGTGNVNDLDYTCAVDPVKKELRPMFYQQNVELLERYTTLEERTNSNYRSDNDIVTLPYVSGPQNYGRVETQIQNLKALATRSTQQDIELESLQRELRELQLVDQPQASLAVTVAQLTSQNRAGTVILYPSGDEWIETNIPPELVVNQGGTFDTIAARANALGIVFGTIWNQWQVTQMGQPINIRSEEISRTTRDNGIIDVVDAQIVGAVANERRTGVTNELIDNTETIQLNGRLTARASISYIRSRPIVFQAEGLLAGTNHFAFLDDVDVTPYVQQATQLLIDTRTPDYSFTEFQGSTTTRNVFLKFDNEVTVGQQVVNDPFRRFTGLFRNDTRETVDQFNIIYSNTNSGNPTAQAGAAGVALGAASGFGADNDPARGIIRPDSVVTAFQRGEVIRGRTTGTTAIVVLHEQSINQTANNVNRGYADGAADVLHVVNIKAGPAAATTIDPVTGVAVVNQTGFLDGELIDGSFVRVLPNGTRKTVQVKLRAFRATQTPAPGTLISSGQGRVAGLWLLTAGQVIGNRISPKFLTGRRLFSISNDRTNRINVRTSYADTAYDAVGIIDSDRTSFISVRNGHLATGGVGENRTRTIELSARAVTRQIFPPPPPPEPAWGGGTGDGGVGDPLAQSFFVGEETGAFVTHVDLFFARKPALPIPIVVDIREMVNGFPGKIVLPFTSKLLYPNDVFIDAARGTAPTTVKFDAPVFLSPQKEYAVCLTTASEEYQVFVAQQGQRDLVTNQTINLQPTLGSMFLSQNTSTWTASQDRDLKFRLYAAKFLTTNTLIGQSIVEFVNNEIPFQRLASNPFRTNSGSDEFFVYQENHGLVETSSVTFENVPSSVLFGYTRDVNTITDSVFDLGGDDGMLNGTHLVHKVYGYDLYSIKMQLENSPVFARDTGRFGSTEVSASRNILYTTIHPNSTSLLLPGTDIQYRVISVTGKSPSGTESPFISDSAAQAITINDNNYYSSQRMLLSSENESLKNAGQKSFVLQAILSSTNSRITPMLDMTRSSCIFVQNRIDDPVSLKNINSNYRGTGFDGSDLFVSEYEPSGGVAASKYVTKNLSFANNSKSLRIQMAVNIPTAARTETSSSSATIKMATTNGSRKLSVIVNDIVASATAGANPAGATTIALTANPNTKVAVGYHVFGRGIPKGATVTALGATTITISTPLRLTLLPSDVLFVSPLDLSSSTNFNSIETGDTVTGAGIQPGTFVTESVRSTFKELRVTLGAGAGVGAVPATVNSFVVNSVEGVKVNQYVAFFLPITGYASSNERGRDFGPSAIYQVSSVDPITKTIGIKAISGGALSTIATTDATNYANIGSLVTNGNLTDLAAITRLAPNTVYVFDPDVDISREATATTALTSTAALTFTTPANAAVEVYYKVAQSGVNSIAEAPYFRANPDNGALVTTNNPNQFIDLTYTVNTPSDFNIAVVKIVFRSKNAAFIPRIKDFRAVALA
jgi:hypothetical protein